MADEHVTIIGEGFITVALPKDTKFTLIKFKQALTVSIIDKSDTFGLSIASEGMEDFPANEWIHAEVKPDQGGYCAYLLFGDGSTTAHAIDMNLFEIS